MRENPWLQLQGDMTVFSQIEIAVHAAQCPLSPRSNQIPQRSEMTRWANCRRVGAQYENRK